MRQHQPPYPPRSHTARPAAHHPERGRGLPRRGAARFGAARTPAAGHGGRPA
ncbi:hypothetical protein ABZ907_40450 [Nonomuraea wenchangensis]